MAYGDLFSAEDIPVTEGVRRLPIYLVLDTSWSMRGTGIDSLNDGLRRFKKECENVSEAKDTIHICLIEFNSEAKMLTEKLVAINKFSPPILEPNGTTKLSKALALLNQSLDEDLIPNINGEQKGDWRPIIFILTDGFPDPKDEWEIERKKLLERSKHKIVDVITVGCGSNISEENIKKISSGNCFKMSDSSQSFRNFFDWVTATGILASKILTKPETNKSSTFTPPPPPEGIQPLQFGSD